MTTLAMVSCDGGCGRRGECVGPGTTAPKGWFTIMGLGVPHMHVCSGRCMVTVANRIEREQQMAPTITYDASKS